MDQVIYPRSPREMMSGWMHLPRFVDKIRLQLAGKLHPDYQENFKSGFDARWLEAAGLSAEQFITVVKATTTDGEVADWVRTNVKKSDSDHETFNNYLVNRGSDNDEAKAHLEQRKKDCGLSHRTDVKTFFDFIDADEKRI